MYDELTGNLRAQATHFSVHDETSLLLLKAADAIEDLDNKLNLHRQGKISHWIPVAERLPDVWKHVITFDEDDGVRVNWRSGDNVSWYMGYHVTHWMPLPEPPKADKDGEA